MTEDGSMTAALSLLLALLGPAHSQEAIPETDTTIFRQLSDYLNSRYEDFFAHDEDTKRYYQGVRHGIDDQKKERQENLRALLEARRQFRREPKPDTTAAELQHEAEVRAEQAHFDRYRQAYSDLQKQLRRISSSARKIPENRDSGLEESGVERP